MQRLGCLSPLGLLAAAIALLIAAGVVLASGGAMFSPGPLSAARAAQATLGGVASHAELGNSCAACHAEPWSHQTMAQRCLTCHTDTQAQLGNPQTLHGAIQEALVCRNCHTEHHGPQAALTRLDVSFPHDKVGFSLARHQTQANGQPFACADCHGGGLVMFDHARCETCHQSYQADLAAHIQDFGRDCMTCHDGVDRYTGFDHQKTLFALAGKHTRLQCSQCHVNERTPSDLVRAPQGCLDCHRQDDKHQGSLGADCATCHAPDDWKQVKFDHNQSAFKLTGKHVSVACDQCHVNGVLKGVPQACVDCHRQDDKHQGAYGTDCGQCHTSDDWKKAAFDHSLSAFKLTGAHQTVACAKCHVNNVFKGTPQTCSACHPDPQVHQGQFGADCAQCHITTTWKGATFKHTFPLNHGRQGTIACATCHTQPGNFKAYTCYGCHEHDPASIARRHREQRASNLDDCVRCHPGGREGRGGGDD